jgi:hypothetical protein
MFVRNTTKMFWNIVIASQITNKDKMEVKKWLKK